MSPEDKCKSIYFEWLILLWNPQYPAVGMLFPMSVWIYDAIVENRYWNLKAVGVNSCCHLALHLLICISGKLCIWASTAGNVYLVMEKITAQRALHIMPKTMQDTHGAVSQAPSPSLSRTFSVTGPQEQPSSPRPMWELQVATSSWVQNVWSNRVSCWAMSHMESQFFHALLFSSTERLKHTNGQAMGIYHVMWAPVCWPVQQQVFELLLVLLPGRRGLAATQHTSFPDGLLGPTLTILRVVNVSFGHGQKKPCLCAVVHICALQNQNLRRFSKSWLNSLAQILLLFTWGKSRCSPRHTWGENFVNYVFEPLSFAKNNALGTVLSALWTYFSPFESTE